MKYDSRSGVDGVIALRGEDVYNTAIHTLFKEVSNFLSLYTHIL